MNAATTPAPAAATTSTKIHAADLTALATPTSAGGRVFVSAHPLVAHKVRLLRDRTTPAPQVRALVREIATLLGYEATAALPVVDESKARTTPVGAEFVGAKVDADRVGLVPVMRSGNAMVEAFLDLVPMARVLHVGLFREKATLQPVEYYNKLPSTVNISTALILDPLLATAGTAIATVSILKDWGLAGTQIKLVCAVASQSGLAHLREAHPDVTVHVGVVDAGLDDHGYVVPGVGDVGDRLYRTGNHGHDEDDV
ncbi:hypothetical protein GGF32_002159 [Allomyces javanicus]|nr:hypothetical protein GGF32_002159 [Allomyces javanicus]